mmetsp:Transcript_34895/g.87806  ORF Transcript_34895/g.87806 Transcript_34895/m.87806 type:complete len:129 (+) Transcript_34895:952-1338(+)
MQRRRQSMLPKLSCTQRASLWRRHTNRIPQQRLRFRHTVSLDRRSRPSSSRSSRFRCSVVRTEVVTSVAREAEDVAAVGIIITRAKSTTTLNPTIITIITHTTNTTSTTSQPPLPLRLSRERMTVSFR